VIDKVYKNYCIKTIAITKEKISQVNYSKDLLPLASSAQRAPPGLMDDRSKVLSDKVGGAATVLQKKQIQNETEVFRNRSNNQRNGIAAKKKKNWREEQPTELQQKTIWQEVNAVEIPLFLALPLPAGATPSGFCPHLAPTRQHQRDANKDAKSEVEARRGEHAATGPSHPLRTSILLMLEKNRSPEWRGKGEM
jgi:hypothetical protein